MAMWSPALAAHLVPARVLEQRAQERQSGGKTGGKLATGVAMVDGVTGGGWPRGALNELSGPRSSGRTTLLYLSLAQALVTGEAAALVDVGGGLDPRWAQTLGVPLHRLLWVRCQSDQALQAAELVVAAGGFGFVAVDFGDAYVNAPTAAWLRLKRAAAAQRTALLISTLHRPQGAQSQFAFRLDPGRPVFHHAGAGGSPLLVHLDAHAHLARQATGHFEAPPANTIGTLQFTWTRGPVPPNANAA